jgi:hypothetical protein
MEKPQMPVGRRSQMLLIGREVGEGRMEVLHMEESDLK